MAWTKKERETEKRSANYRYQYRRHGTNLRAARLARDDIDEFRNRKNSRVADEKFRKVFYARYRPSLTTLCTAWNEKLIVSGIIHYFAPRFRHGDEILFSRKNARDNLIKRLLSRTNEQQNRERPRWMHREQTR